MEARSLALEEDGGVAFAPPARASATDEARLRALRHEHFEFIWRSVRRLGVPEADADDAVQQVFIVAARKLDVITMKTCCTASSACSRSSSWPPASST